MSESGHAESMSHRRPGKGRYSKLEREQRWVARGVPDEAELTAEILDRYIVGTTLRLRRVSLAGGSSDIP